MAGPNNPGWKIRVVPSISGIFDMKGELDRHGKGIYDLMNGVGAHEVIITTPYHGINSDYFDDAQLTGVVDVVVQRIKDLRKDERLKYALVYKNHGKIAGGSNLGHMHMQLIATPATPKRVKEELIGARRYFEYRDRCIYCDIIKQELNENTRVICQTDDFLAINPFCSRFPFEIWILPKNHNCDFDTMEKSQMVKFGGVFKEIFIKMFRMLGDFPYNAILHTAPFRRRKRKGYWETIAYDYHWHVEIMPRLTHVAGFEWGSGFYINTVAPEMAAKNLKNS